MGINQSDCLSYLHVISPPSNLRMQNKALFTALCVALFAAAIAVPVNEDLQTKEEFGAVKNAIGSAANKFSSWLKGKECQLRSCSACETKTKRSWGRRRLLSQDLSSQVPRPCPSMSRSPRPRRLPLHTP